MSADNQNSADIGTAVGNAQDGTTFGALVVDALARHPDRIAFRMEGREIGYRALREQIYAIAHALQARGFGRGDGLAVLLGNSPELFALRSAAALIGMRYTPLAALGTASSHAFILADAEIAVLVTDSEHRKQAETGIGQSGRTVQLVMLDGYPDSLIEHAARCDATHFSPVPHEDDLDLLAYTGGTTGRQKGVMLPHRVMVHNAMVTICNWEAPSDLRMLLVSPLSHAALLIVLPTLLRGGTVHLLRKFDVDAMLATIERERITATMLVPSMLYALLDCAKLADADVSSLRQILYIASPIAPSRLKEAIARFGKVFEQWYGQTEAPNVITQLRRDDHDVSRPHLLASCGKPMIGVEVALLDDAGLPVACGEEGEICVRGRLVMDGYWRNPQATQQALADNWLHTGDIARTDDEGYFYIVDRKKDIIISGGFNVYPREIEDIIAAHPDVALAAVIGVPDPKWGEAVRAIVQLRDGSAGHPALAVELVDFVKSRLGSVNAPKAVDFVASVPLTPVGKVDKVALRKGFWTGETRRVN